MNPVDPILCATVELTYGERDRLETYAQDHGWTSSEALRHLVLVGLERQWV